MVKRTRKPVAESLESRRLMAAVSMDAHWDHHAKQITAPLQIENASGVRAAEVRIQYDPQVLTTDASNIRVGDFWEDNAGLVVNVDQEQGTIIAFVYTAQAVDQTDGDVIEIDFEYRTSQARRLPTTIDVQEVELNEGQIGLDNAPVTGEDNVDRTLSPMPQRLDFQRGNRHTDRFGQPPWWRTLRPADVDVMFGDRMADDACGSIYGPQLPSRRS
ncbi:cohesin domain-containing protein [Roseiconus lacunae]|uniref:Cohesin domain-containing protein n=1 Tax=Roseiconus lacunae TaxID=2605694 RepID=A0ABT7PSR1_9BACT|nr:cohesin domain-containing protein [Roseiconus lacunae]MCD0462626.1 cohesin domain-containing protein [Roseiconus lacunae]MDM4019171.1 cohesin domain-containing protein [Roseiconus lacunae]WRQ49025.1 cohesin domain-containing protein [Stieleria sp. HD01]